MDSIELGITGTVLTLCLVVYILGRYDFFIPNVPTSLGIIISTQNKTTVKK